MRIKNTEQKFAELLDATTPDVYDKIRSQCIFVSQEAEQSAPEANAHFRKVQFRNAFLIPAAACLILVCLCLVFLYPIFSNQSGKTAIVTVDVNPSISLEVDSDNTVRSVSAINDDGEQILEDLGLTGCDVNEALKALIHAMIEAGYLNELENSVLLGISGTDDETGEELQSALMRTTRRAFTEDNFDGAILSTIVTEAGDDIEDLTEKYQISQGKAALAIEISSQVSNLIAEDVAEMSINEINLLVSSKNYTLSDVSSQGTASSKAYITEEEALELAFVYSTVSKEDAEYITVHMDYNSGVVTYEVEFYLDSYKYEYEMNAITGELMEWEMEWKNDTLLAIEMEELEKSQTITGIGEEQALAIALAHAQVSESDLLFEYTVPAYEDGREFYEVEFYTEEHEYEYKIEVLTGEILEYTSYSVDS